MKANMGTLDKMLRISVAILIAVLYFTDVISGTWAMILGAFAIVFILTSSLSFCPLYLPFKINTRKAKR